MPFVFFDEVHKSFEGKEVLRGLTVLIRKKEMLVILGGSGSGKTVILKHIVGLLNPDRGRVYLEERPGDGFGEADWLEWRRQIGFLFQNGALFDSMTVLENVAFPLREHTRLSDREIRGRVREKLKLVGLESVEKMMPDKLSGGMRKRVALARAVILEPQAVLYDEPTTGLDPITCKWVTKLMRGVHEKLNVTSVVVTHNIQSALSIADRIAFLHRGRIRFLGTPAEIQASDDRIIQDFLKG
ncbi:ABC transporter ATP-binding protein [bacterium]|nr:ABC transporter ATP-binding protein [bacterium]